jgi:hypothetical protein
VRLIGGCDVGKVVADGVGRNMLKVEDIYSVRPELWKEACKNVINRRSV